MQTSVGQIFRTQVLLPLIPVFLCRVNANLHDVKLLHITAHFGLSGRKTLCDDLIVVHGRKEKQLV